MPLCHMLFRCLRCFSSGHFIITQLSSSSDIIGCHFFTGFASSLRHIIIEQSALQTGPPPKHQITEEGRQQQEQECGTTGIQGNKGVTSSLVGTA